MEAAGVEAGPAGAEAGRSGLRQAEAEAAGLSAVEGDLDPVLPAVGFITIIIIMAVPGIAAILSGSMAAVRVWRRMSLQPSF